VPSAEAKQFSPDLSYADQVKQVPAEDVNNQAQCPGVDVLVKLVASCVHSATFD